MKKYLRHNMNVFQKVEWLKELSSEAIGVTNERALRRMLGRLRRKGTATLKKYGPLYFSQQELVLDQILKANEVSPKTAYMWLLALKSPQEVLESGQKGKISQNQMFRMCRHIKQKTDPERETLGKEILQDILRLIEVI